MSAEVVKKMRHILTGGFWYYLACLTWRGIILDLIDAYEQAKAKSLEAAVEKQNLTAEVAALKENLDRTKRGNKVLQDFIRARHSQNSPVAKSEIGTILQTK